MSYLCIPDKFQSSTEVPFQQKTEETTTEITIWDETEQTIPGQDCSIQCSH